eukprot:221625-Pelagomonas_calceolata.AAC.4
MRVRVRHHRHHHNSRNPFRPEQGSKPDGQWQRDELHDVPHCPRDGSGAAKWLAGGSTQPAMVVHMAAAEGLLQAMEGGAG